MEAEEAGERGGSSGGKRGEAQEMFFWGKKDALQKHDICERNPAVTIT